MTRSGSTRGRVGAARLRAGLSLLPRHSDGRFLWNRHGPAVQLFEVLSRLGQSWGPLAAAYRRFLLRVMAEAGRCCHPSGLLATSSSHQAPVGDCSHAWAGMGPAVENLAHQPAHSASVITLNLLRGHAGPGIRREHCCSAWLQFYSCRFNLVNKCRYIYAIGEKKPPQRAVVTNMTLSVVRLFFV